MIRFACPGCRATYSVEDARGGKAGKCKKCGVAFVIPFPEPARVPPPVSVPPPPVDPPPVPIAPAAPPPVLTRALVVPPPFPNPDYSLIGTMPGASPNAVPDASRVTNANAGLNGEEPPGVDIAPCPGCQARLTVSQADLGGNVECPYCKTIFAAVKPGAIVAPPRVMDAEVVSSSNDYDRSSRHWEDGPVEAPAKRNRSKGPRKVGGSVTVASIGILSAAKMSAGMGFVVGVLYSLIYGFFALVLYLIGTTATGDPGGMMGLGMLWIICGLIFLPFVMTFCGFIGGAISALIYNLLAQMLGGVEMDLE